MAKPKLALIPAAQGSKFYSVLPSDGVGDFDFTRASSATRVNKDGLIETVASGQSRLNYPLIDGVVNGCPSHLLEPSRQNVLWYSQDFTNAYWINNGVTVNADQAISPDGTLNADLLTGVSGGFGVVRFSTWSATNNVASCFAKKASSSTFIIKNASGGVGGVTFDLDNGVITSVVAGFEGEIENYGNGWYRCIAKDRDGRTGTFSLGVNGAGESIYMWGSQLEQTHKTSYIPTTNSSVTRVAETANGAGDANTFNDSEGVLFAEISAIANDGTIRRIALPNSSAAGLHRIELSSTDNRVFGVTYVSPSNQAVISYIMPDATTPFKIAYKYKENDFALWVDGFERGADSSGSVPTGLVKINFDNGAGGSDFYGNTKQIQYFDSALNDTDLETLTSWTSFSEMATSQLYSIQ